MHGLIQHREALFKRHLPESLAEFGDRVAAPHVVHQDVELTLLLTLDAGCEFLDVAFFGVIATHGNAFAAAGSDHLCSLIDGFAAAFGSGFAWDATLGAIE